MQTKPIFFNCDLGRFQLVVLTLNERCALHKFSCDLCDLHSKSGCEYAFYGGDCTSWDDSLQDINPYASVHWKKVLPTSTSAKTPRAERGTKKGGLK